MLIMSIFMTLNIVYTYHHGLRIWREIEYSILSMRKFLTEKHKIYIIGPINPHISDTIFIKSEIDPSKNKECNCNQSLKKCCDMFDSFLWCNDDMYLLKNTSKEDLLSIPPLHTLKNYNGKTHRAWLILLNNTCKFLRKNGFVDIDNFSTHTPQYYESKKMKILFDKYRNLDLKEKPKELEERGGAYYSDVA